jgi:hypothetical protein
VTAEELWAALRRMPSGRAPGPDGIPLELYRKYWPACGEILLALFNAVGAVGAVPRGFLGGAIVVLHKKGDRTQPGNYRPITLLGADYRLLGRVLGARLTRVLGGVIDREQTGFLPGRHVGENVLALQLLPQLLRQQGRSAALVFLDVRRAYDTLRRPFLLSCLETMGAGPGFVGWVRLLLWDTRAVAVVNGHASAPVRFTAGVRQGCPLSPPLYLVAAQALLTWLKHEGHGLDLLPAGAPPPPLAAMVGLALRGRQRSRNQRRQERDPAGGPRPAACPRWRRRLRHAGRR